MSRGPQPGDAVDRYVVEGLLGQGGMASVYLCRHRVLGSRHVLKVLDVAGTDPAERLMDEGRVQATLVHPNVVPVTDIIDVDGAPGLIMAYVQGPNLQALLKARRLTDDEVEVLVPRLLAGVRAAHQQGFVHRDLKPGNVLLAVESGGVVPKVADFGLVKRTEGALSRTRTGATLGTPQYLAPEQIRGSEGVDQRADVWSMGVMVQEMLTGRKVFDANNAFDVLSMVSSLELTPLGELRPELPEPWIRAVQGALQPVEDRWERIDAFWGAWAGQADLETASRGPAAWDVDGLMALVDPVPEPASTLQDSVPIATSEGAGADPTGRSTGTWAFETEVAPTAQDETPPTESMDVPTASSPTTAWLAGLVVLGLAAVAWVVVSGWSPSGEATPPGNVRAAPINGPQPSPEALPSPEPSPEAPSPEPPPEAPPTPLPEPAAAAAPTPAPAAEPPAPDRDEGATWKGPSNVAEAYLSRDGVRHPPGAISPGRYALVVRWEDHEDGKPPATFQDVVVAAGEELVVSCAMHHCLWRTK